MADVAPNLAWACALEAFATVVRDRPFPKGLNEAEVGDWRMQVNASGEELTVPGYDTPIEAWGLVATHKDFLLIVVLGPGGGVIGGGMSEDAFIEQMRAIAASTPVAA